MDLKEGLSFIRVCSPWLLLIGRASLPDSLRSSVHFVLAIFFLYLCCLSIWKEGLWWRNHKRGSDSYVI